MIQALYLVACEDVKKLLMSLHGGNITESITSFELRVECQAEQCRGQGIHCLTSDSLQESVSGSVCTYVKCERTDKLREIIRGETYWYQKKNYLSLNGIIFHRSILSLLMIMCFTVLDLGQATESCKFEDQQINSISTSQGNQVLYHIS